MMTLEGLVSREIRNTVIIPGFIILVLFSAILSFLSWQEYLKTNRIIMIGVENYIDTYLQNSQTYLETASTVLPDTPEESSAGLFAAMMQDSSVFERVLWINPDNTIKASYPVEITGIDFPIPLKNDQSRLLSTPRISPLSGSVVVYVSRRTHDGGKIVGELDLQHFQESLTERFSGYSRSILISDKFGNVISHQDYRLVLERANLGHIPLLTIPSNQEQTTDIFSLHKIRYIGTAQSIPSTNWKIVLYERLDSAFLRLFSRIHGLLLACLLFIVGIILFLKRKIKTGIVRPIQQFTRTVEGIGRGDAAEIMEPVNSYTELDTLGKEIFSMDGKIRQREEELQQEKNRIEKINQKLALAIKEVHHRTKNNLATVISLLNLKARSHNDQNITEALRAAAARVQSIINLHELLYETDQFEQIDLNLYLGRLCRWFQNSIQSELQDVTIEFKLDHLLVSPKTALANGLIVNELITNALKYAFPEGRGTIFLRLKRDTKQSAVVTIRDTGIGMPQNREKSSQNPLGMILVESMVKNDLGSALTYRYNQGAEFFYTTGTE